MKYKVGDKVRIKSLDWYNENKDEFGNIDINEDFTFYADRSRYCGKVFTISEVFDNCYDVKEDNNEYYWIDEMIEGLVEEETKYGTASNPVEPKSNANCLTRERVDALAIKIDKELPYGNQNVWELPEGYQFVDENGNVINATKIFLEKKKDVDLTQGQINAMVQDSCVSFCKHCGSGVPRETCTSLGTCKEYDEYRAAIRTYLMEKKKEYPKTYEECCKVLGVEGTWHVYSTEWEEYDKLTPYEKKLDYITSRLKQILICRNAYWKIAGEKMGLGKPWEPDYDSGVDKFGIICLNGGVQESNPTTNWERHLNKILDFPTRAMRAAFYENFKELIESVKELL